MRTLMEMRFPLGSEMMTTVRLACGGLCALSGFDMDESEDCKVCVTESLLLVMHAGFSHARICFSEEHEELFIRVTGEGERAEGHTMPEDEISLALLEALASDVVTERADGAVSEISFRF